MIPDDGGYSGPYIDVDVTSIHNAAEELASIGNGLMDTIDGLMGAAALPLAGLPQDGDEYRAYAFWWGRWSSVIETVEPAVRLAAETAAGAAHGFTRVDEDGRIDLTLPAGG